MRTPKEWDAIFMEAATLLSQRSKDDSTQCGAILVSQDNATLSTGFNGPPPNIVDSKVPWNSRPQKYAFVIHAEENAMWYGVEAHGFDRIKSSRMYCTHHPCSECILRMIRCRISRCIIPKTIPEYPLSKYQVTPDEVLNAQVISNETLKIERL